MQVQRLTSFHLAQQGDDVMENAVRDGNKPYQNPESLLLACRHLP